MKRPPSPALALTFALGALVLGACGRSFVPATPPGFVDLGDRYSSHEYRATTADGVVLGIRAFDNDPPGQLAFWSRTLERRTREMAGYALLEKRDVVTNQGLKGALLRFGHDEGKEPYLYDLAIFVTDKKIFVLEAGGPKGEVTKQEPQIEWAIRNFAPK